MIPLYHLVTQMWCYSTHWFQRYGLGQTKMAHSLTIGRNLECAIQTELVVEPDIPLIRRKQSFLSRFQCHMPDRYKSVLVRIRHTKVKLSDKLKGHPRSPCASNLVQIRLLFTYLRYLKKIGMRHFSLIGCHLETVGRTELVFELNLAPSEKRPTYKFRSDSGIFLSSKVPFTLSQTF